MNLADGIEAWGEAHKKHLDPASLQKLGSVWSTVRKAEVGSCTISEMSKDDARDVMALFDDADRSEIAELLNAIRTWSLDQDLPLHEGVHEDVHEDVHEAPSGDGYLDTSLGMDGDSHGGLEIPELDADFGDSGYGRDPATPLVEMAPLASDAPLSIETPLSTETPIAHADITDDRDIADLIPEPTLANSAPVSPAPVNPASSGPTPIVTASPADFAAPPAAQSIDPMQQYPHAAPPAPTSRLTSPVVVPQGPAPALPPPLGYEDDKPAQPPWIWIAAACVAIIVIAGLYFALRGDDATTTTTTDDTAAATDDTAAATDGAAATGDTGATGDASVIQGTTAEDTNAAITGTGGDDFCTLAREYSAQDPLASLSIVDGPTFFQVADDVWARLGRVAPAEIANDIGVVQAQMASMSTLAAQYNYNTFDPGFATAMQTLDLTAVDQSSSNIDNYVTTTCGVTFDAGLSATSNSTAGSGVNPEVVNE